MTHMFLKNVKYILSAPNKQFWINDDKKEICVVGRSNVGKSTFINKICNQNALAKVSGTPGYTKYINFFDFLNRNNEKRDRRMPNCIIRSLLRYIPVRYRTAFLTELFCCRCLCCRSSLNRSLSLLCAAATGALLGLLLLRC